MFQSLLQVCLIFVTKRFVNFTQLDQINAQKVQRFEKYRQIISLIQDQQFTINLTDNYMKQNRKRYTQGLQDPLESTQQLYDPFSRTMSNYGVIKKNISKNCEELECSITLFEDFQDQSVDGRVSQQPHQKQVELNVMKQISNVNFRSNKAVSHKNDSAAESNKDNSILNKIIANKKIQKSKAYEVKSNENTAIQPFGFNDNFRVAYPQTPGFKNLLHSPFGKFNSLFKQTILTLSKQKQADNRFNTAEPIQLSSNPLQFYNKNKLSFDCGKYFNGISLKLKEMNFFAQSLFFSCLSCYAQPFNSYSWKRYVSLVQQQGKLSRACVLAKTGFLFTQNQQLAKTFISLGERCGMQIAKIQGIMCSISTPEAYEKTLLPQSCKLQIKFGKSWKGLKLLWQICKTNDYRLSVCINTLFMSRFLQNIDFQQKGLSLLRVSFSKSMSKLQIYLQYLEMSIRINNGLVEADLQEVLKYLDCISGQNRYKLLLQIAQILYKNNDQRFYNFICNSFRAAVEYCAVGAGCNKALKQIYYTVAKLKLMYPKVKQTLSDNLVFQINRRKFVNGQDLLEHQFEDWKYYLHYGVVKRYDILADAARKWPLTGRIIAEWIHSLRSFRDPLEMLKIWRDKIDEVPKSGQLWCEGGRIYVELGEYNNAQKCFRCAMHFTPQYGDSFIQELKLLLRQNRLLQIQKLRKLFLVSEPFYGHVLSYLKFHHWKSYSLSLNQVWKNAVYQISEGLYKHSQEETKKLTAFAPYNRAYLYSSTPEQRQILFYSYQQMENKN